MKDACKDEMVRCLNTALPDDSARCVGGITGKGGFHATPGEVIRHLARRDMEHVLDDEHGDARGLLALSLNENSCALWSRADLFEERVAATQ